MKSENQKQKAGAKIKNGRSRPETERGKITNRKRQSTRRADYKSGEKKQTTNQERERLQIRTVQKADYLHKDVIEMRLKNETKKRIKKLY